jgi:hypothetical protein
MMRGIRRGAIAAVALAAVALATADTPATASVGG